MTFDLDYHAPDGSVGIWQRPGFDGGHVEDDMGDEEQRHLLSVERGSDSDSIPSSPSKSLRGSRMSLTSHAVKNSAKA